MARSSRVDAKTVIKALLSLKLATKVHLLSIDQKSSERVKRSKAECLVKRLLAVKIKEYIYQRVAEKSADEFQQTTSKPYIPFGLEPSIDAQIGVRVLFPVLKNQVRHRFFSESAT